MNMTKEYEMQQISLAIAYFEQKLQDAHFRKEVEEIKDKINSLTNQYKELESAGF